MATCETLTLDEEARSALGRVYAYLLQIARQENEGSSAEEEMASAMVADDGFQYRSKEMEQ